MVSGTLPALHALKATGKVRYVSITGLPLSKLRHLLDRVPAGTIDTVLFFLLLTKLIILKIFLYAASTHLPRHPGN